jgi:hypothetical protein
MATITVTDITLPTEGRIWSEVIEGVTHVYVGAAGAVTNDAGKRIREEGTVELTTAAQKQAAQTILNAWVAAKKAEWSMT